MVTEAIQSLKKIRFNVLYLLVFFVISVVISFLQPSIDQVTAQTKQATNNDLITYELATQFLEIWDTANNACVDPFGDQVGRREGVLFEDTIRADGNDSYTDSKYYGLVKFQPLENNANFMVSQDVDDKFGDGGDRDLGCITAVKKLMVVTWGSREKALQAMYDTSQKVNNNYQKKSGIPDLTTFFIEELRGKAAELETLGNFSSRWELYRRNGLRNAFDLCYEFSPAATGTKDKSNEDDYKNKKGDSEGVNVGYGVEDLAMGEYEDGRLNCGQIKTAYFNLQLYEDSGDEEFQNDIKAVEIRKILQSDQNKYVFCIGSSDSELLKAMPGFDSLDIIVDWLVAGNDDASFVVDGATGEEISAATLKKIKDCLLNKDAFGEELADELEAEVVVTPGSEGGENNGEGDSDSCDVQVNNPLSWVICPVLTILEGAVNKFATLAKEALNFQLDDNTNKLEARENFEKIWMAMRDVANILFVIAFLGIIISQALIGKL